MISAAIRSASPVFRRGRVAARLTAIGLAAACAGAMPAGAEPDMRDWAAALMTSENGGQSFRAALQSAAATGGTLDAETLIAIVGFAATHCTATAPSTLGTAESELFQDIAQRLAGADPASADGVEASIAVSQCMDSLGDAAAARSWIRTALDRALALPAGADRDAAIVRVADAAGLGGTLTPQEIGALADSVGAPDAEAAILRAWAYDVLLWRGSEDLELVGVGPYTPLLLDPTRAMAAVKDAVAEQRHYDALLHAAALDLDQTDVRPAGLRTVFEAAVAAGDPAVARLAARAEGDIALREAMLADLAHHALQSGRPADAEYAARLMQPSLGAVTVWLEVARAYHEMAYPAPQQTAFDTALALARSLDDADRGGSLMLVARQAADLGSIDLAVALLDEGSNAANRPAAAAAVAARLAEMGRIEDALRWASDLRDPATDPAFRSLAFATIATALAESGDVAAALALLQQHPDLEGPRLDRALQVVAHLLAADAHFEQARAAAERIDDPALRDRTALELAAAQGDASLLGLVGRRVEMALQDEDADRRDATLALLAETLGEHGQVGALVTLRDRLIRLAPGQDIDPIQLHIAIGQAQVGDFAAAEAATLQITDPELADRARASVGRALAEADRIEQAVALIRGMEAERDRLTAFRLVAEIQALRRDSFGVVPAVYAERPLAGEQSAATIDLATSSVRHPAPVAAQAGIAIFDLDGDPRSDWPEISGLSDRAQDAAATPADIRALVTAASDGIGVYRQQMTANPYNEKFIEIVPILDYAQRQGEPTPHLIALTSGVATVSQLRESLLLIGRDDYLEVENGIYTLRRPIVIGADATLIIAGSDVRALRLSTDDYAYIVSGGALVIADTEITSWDDARQTPTELGLGEAEFLFRPFITAWSGSETYATRTIFRALGYNNRKSWGLTASSGPQDFTFDGQSVMDSPHMVIVENLFEQLYYGFYSYHTNFADIIGNEYRNSVIYGPDPHDYSESILMALNTAYGTQKKHGMIVSREVSGLFVGNLAFDNHGAGIMLDRLSNHSIIYANTAFGNGNDGITVYETACVIVANNQANGNDISGIRVRNSVDVAVLSNTITDNTAEGVVAYTDPLIEHTWRNLELDPFWTIVSAAFVDNHITGNDGAFRFENMLAATLAHNAIMGNGDRWFAGDFQPVLGTLVRSFRLDRDSVMLADLCQPEAERYVGCRFRELGLFDFDGQTDWQFTDQPPQCTGNFVVTSDGLREEPGL